jgi:DNA-damage-inducible protein J
MSRTLTVTLDDNVKETADKLFADMGINTATAVRMFIYSSVKNKKISFDLTKKRPNPKLLRAISDANAGNNLSPKFDTAKDAVASMMADD